MDRSWAKTLRSGFSPRANCSAGSARHRSNRLISSVTARALDMTRYREAYAKVSLKKYKPMAARNEDRNVSSGLL